MGCIPGGWCNLRAMLWLPALALLTYSSVFSHRPAEIAPIFKGYDATFIFKEFGGSHILVLNPKRASQRFSPCSTFKVVNTMVGLDAGVVKDETTTFLWDGRHYDREAANKDQTLESAFKNSIVWYYQELARRVGRARMQAALDRIPYGNRDTSGGIDRFWLESTLQISPMEQLAIIERLYARRLPFSVRAQELVMELMVQEDTLNWKYSGKTGSGNLPKGRSIGWFVGSVQSGVKRYIFAVNIEGPHASGMKANELTHRALAKLGLTAYPLHPGKSYRIDALRPLRRSGG